MSHKGQIIIGIDPDVDRNGIAMLDMSTHSLQVQMLAFPNLLDFIKEKYRKFAEIDKSTCTHTSARIGRRRNERNTNRNKGEKDK